MVDLQQSLMAIGGVIVAGVIAYNKWQEWRAKKSVEQAFSTTQDDVLMGDGAVPDRAEPTLAAFEAPDLIAEHADVGALHAPQVSPGPASVDFDDDLAWSAAAAGGATRRSPLDAKIDCIIPMALEAPLRGERVAQAFQQLHLLGNKPVRVVGHSEVGEWEPVAVGSVYDELQVGVQLATRFGALTELEFSELASRLDRMSDDLGARPELPEMSEVTALARDLHHQITQFDAQLSINIRATAEPWPVVTLKSALQRQGMEQRPDGQLVMPDGEGSLLFSANINANHADNSSTQITLLLPVAMVAADRGGFKAMTAFAKTLANRLTGAVVDDDGQPLPDAALAAIAEQVGDFYREMDHAGIPAGSPLARRLFA